MFTAVEFPNGTHDIVPKSWTYTLNGEHFCAYPNDKKTIRYHVMNNTPPNSDWPHHKVVKTLTSASKFLKAINHITISLSTNH